MKPEFQALNVRPLQRGARVRTPRRESERLTPGSPAIQLMTDFSIVPAATTAANVSAEEADRSMAQRGVRSLIVLSEAGQVAGLITAAEVMGEAPLKVALARQVRHDEVLVADVMIAVGDIDVISYDVMKTARIGDVIETLRRAGRQHALVAEAGPQGDEVRGIISLSRIASELGIVIETLPVAHTFAEVEAALVR
jgi:CBS domain containing-hemolysin-like protein